MQQHSNTDKSYDVYSIKTRMITFIKTKLKISDDQTNIDKYRLAAIPIEFPNQREKNTQIGP